MSFHCHQASIISVEQSISILMVIPLEEVSALLPIGLHGKRVFVFHQLYYTVPMYGFLCIHSVGDLQRFF